MRPHYLQHWCLLVEAMCILLSDSVPVEGSSRLSQERRQSELTVPMTRGLEPAERRLLRESGYEVPA